MKKRSVSYFGLELDALDDSFANILYLSRCGAASLADDNVVNPILILRIVV